MASRQASLPGVVQGARLEGRITKPLSVRPGNLHQVIFPPKRGSAGALPDPGIQFPGGVVLKLRWSSFAGDRINVSVPLTPDFQSSESPF